VSTDPLSYVLASLRRASDNAYSWSLTPSEAGALVAEIERLRKAVDNAREEGAQAERAVVLDYLSYRAEMSHYPDAITEFVNAHHEIGEGAHHTLNYDEVLP